MMLIDKGYYDYDYQEPSKEKKVLMNSVKNDEELKLLLRHLGIEPNKKSETAEDLQRIAMAEENSQP